MSVYYKEIKKNYANHSHVSILQRKKKYVLCKSYSHVSILQRKEEICFMQMS